MNIAPLKYNFTNLKDLENPTDMLHAFKDKQGLEINNEQISNLKESIKASKVINITDAEIKEQNRHKILQKVEEILNNYSKNLIYSNNKIYSDELSRGYNFSENSYFKNIKASDSSSMLSTLKSRYLENTKFKNLNDYAYSNTLKTKYGEVEVFLDIYGDNDKLGTTKLENNSYLFSFDSNNDGVLDQKDILFDKLKVRGYDKDGNEKIANLSDVMPRVDLRQFISTNVINHNQIEREELNRKATITNNPDLYVDTKDIDYRHSYYASDPNTLFAAENRYEKIEKNDINNFFKKYAQNDGWVDLRHNNIFGKDSSFKNFAYLKVGFDDTARLSEFNPIIEPSKEHKKDENFSYTKFQKDSFMKFYKDYNTEFDAYNKMIENLGNNLKKFDESADSYISKLEKTKSAKMIAMENEFKQATGLEFSISNLKKVKKAFITNEATAAASLQDSDSVIAMKLNKDGTIRLKFDSGREIDVKELYNDTGKLNTSSELKTSINLEAKDMNNVQLNSLDFKDIGFMQGDKIVSLKDAGAIAIANLSNKFESKFLISLNNGKSISTREIYNISYLENDLKSKEKIDERDKFYKKVDIKA
ncbi:response regulator [Campylobacter concisus]|uniref:response regulator n=1 Tax=Campylobacter concisus TaxID=199 RepID=UPI000A002080|nr:response regulator [Campylobacter concisus]MBE9817805.1 response regulator [Campylobacter concisus]ORI11024.1 response regulator [Campylobacter concisus]